MESLLRLGRKIIPRSVFEALQPVYHYGLALVGAIIYRFPSKHITVIAITGTKGKSSTTEILNAILEEAGFKTAVIGTVRFKMGSESRRNLYKMTMPGRFFVQKFLREAVDKKCQYAILEMTSQAAVQYRHKFIDFDSLIFLNISPEHIEAHGSFENYLAAKLMLAKALEKSKKRPRTIIVNKDDVESPKFLDINVEQKLNFTPKDVDSVLLKDDGALITIGDWTILTNLKGMFNVYNTLAAMAYAKTQNVSMETIKNAMQKLKVIPGRVQKVDVGQGFDVVVDYAHTADSLEKLYQAFPNQRKVCVLGNTGGGRDTWKRPEMAKIADTYCDHIILTNEDPYDENPRDIIEDMLKGISAHQPQVIMDRREAIHQAILKAKAMRDEREPSAETEVNITNRAAAKDIAVLISGKGTDPYIMEADGKKTPWDDATVAREELQKIFQA